MTKVLLHELGKSVSFGRLSLLGKVLWPMLLAASDDQGRGQAEADVIKWTVCPNVQELTVENISALMQEMVDQAMLHVYKDGRGRVLYQAVRWWEYQNPQWAQPSRYEAPEGWTDRVRANRRDSEYLCENWDTGGGFGVPQSLSETPPTEPPGNAPGNPPGNAPEGAPGPITKLNLTEPKQTKTEEPPTAGAKPPGPLTKRQQSQAMFGALAELCQINWEACTDKQRGALNQSEAKLRKAGAVPEQMPRFGEWWYEHDWRGKKGEVPRPSQVREGWGKFAAWWESTTAHADGVLPERAEQAPDVALWGRILDDLRGQMSLLTFSEHFAGSLPVGRGNGAILVQVRRAGSVEALVRLQAIVDKTATRYEDGLRVEFRERGTA